MGIRIYFRQLALQIPKFPRLSCNKSCNFVGARVVHIKLKNIDLALLAHRACHLNLIFRPDLKLMCTHSVNFVHSSRFRQQARAQVCAQKR